MNRPLSTALLASALGLLLTGPQTAGAADISVMPVGLTLTAAQDRATITVTNQGKERVALQVDSVAWTQANGADQYTPSRDLIVNPPLFTLAPGQAQTLRVGLRQPAARAQETAYRLFVRQVPAPSETSTPVANAVQVMLELRLPVYLPPTTETRQSTWRGWRTADGQVALELHNAGNVHQTVTGLSLRQNASASDPLGQLQAGNAVLAGQRRRWTVPVTQAVGADQRLTLDVATDKGPERVALQLGQP